MLYHVLSKQHSIHRPSVACRLHHHSNTGVLQVICAGSLDTFQIYVWSVRTGRLLDVLAGHEGPVPALAFSPSQPLLASASWDHTVRTWDVFRCCCLCSCAAALIASACIEPWSNSLVLPPVYTSSLGLCFQTWPSPKSPEVGALRHARPWIWDIARLARHVLTHVSWLVSCSIAHCPGSAMGQNDFVCTISMSCVLQHTPSSWSETR